MTAFSICWPSKRMARSCESLTRTRENAGETAEIARVPDVAHNLAGSVRLNIADVDNNGALDLILLSTSGSGNGALIGSAMKTERSRR